MLVDVPAELLSLLDTLLTTDEKECAALFGVTLYLDEVEKGHWVFGFDVGNGVRAQDLRPYTPAQFPVRAEKRK